jgi:hypothetical protein
MLAAFCSTKSRGTTMLHTDTITLNSNSNNPYEVARCTLLKALARISIPRAGTLDCTATLIRDIADACDGCMQTIGHQVSDISERADLDYRVFDAPFMEAVEGEATYIAELGAEAMYGVRRVA